MSENPKQNQKNIWAVESLIKDWTTKNRSYLEKTAQEQLFGEKMTKKSRIAESWVAYKFNTASLYLMTLTPEALLLSETVIK